MKQNKEILSFINDQEDIDLGQRILDIAERVKMRKQLEATEFLNPHQLNLAKDILNQLAEINFKADGGYKNAERKRIAIFPDYLFPDHQDVPLTFYKVLGNFNYINISHSDFLGAIMGLGIKRGMLGDIILIEDYAQIIVAPEIKKEIELNLTSVSEVPVEVEEIDTSDIKVRPENKKEILATVASLRLDAVLSAGFGESRSKSNRAITSGKVKLNWKKEENPAAEVEIGDIISLQGRGRLFVAEDRGRSNRDRIKLKLERIT
ncbi:MAG: photosystem II S4 domain protein [Bacillota bacterium]